jgi:hypothetical protein
MKSNRYMILTLVVTAALALNSTPGRAQGLFGGGGGPSIGGGPILGGGGGSILRGPSISRPSVDRPILGGGPTVGRLPSDGIR